MKKLTVNTKDKTYDILIENGIKNRIENYLPESGRVFLVTNDKLTEVYPEFISKFEFQTVLKDGEINKNFRTFEFLVNELLRMKIERGDTVAVFGGGVTGDIGGFAAASVLRGVNLVQIPTTLLSQVDSSVGGKTGFNTEFGKNLVGAFYQPQKVLIDPEVLNTLDTKQIKTGLGEVVKYAFIEKTCSADSGFYLFDYLSGDKIDYSEIIYKSCGLKAAVVSADEKEGSLRMILNLGHTFAHAIETITQYREFTHGEAVAMGIKSAFELSFNLGFIEKNYYLASNALIDKFDLAPVFKIHCNKNDFLDIMRSDKKVQHSKIRLVLPVGAGEVKIFDDISTEEIKKAI